MKVKPVLGSWEIPRIHTIRTDEKRVFVAFDVPGMDGSLYQDTNNKPVQITIFGSLYGDEARDTFLDEVRGKYRKGEPLTFVADIVTATELQYVIIESLRFQESGNKPDQIDYQIVLRQSPPPPPPPDPFGGIDTGLLGEAAGLMDAVNDALDVIDVLGSVPDFGDPTESLSGTLDGVETALDTISSTASSLTSLFSDEEE